MYTSMYLSIYVSTYIQGGRACDSRSGRFPAHRVAQPVKLGRSLPEDRTHLTECIYKLILESHPPHKIVNLLFTITNQNITLKGLSGS